MHRVEIISYLENCSDHAITVPTFTDHIDGVYAFEERVICYNFLPPGSGSTKRKLVESPAKYQPLTLEPGESVELPISRERASATVDKNGTYYVAYVVDPAVAARHGWWHGSLTVKAVPEMEMKSHQP